MTSMTVKEFALELKLPVKTLLAQLREKRRPFRRRQEPAARQPAH